MSLTGKTAIITGAAGGIGKATVALFAEQNANLVLVDYNQQGLEQLTKSLEQKNRKIVSYAIDVSHEPQVKRVVQSTIEEQGQIDILVNCAGICKMIPILDIKVTEWDHMLAVNLRSVFLFCRETFRHMKERKYGKIINIGSAAGKIGDWPPVPIIPPAKRV